jgi:transcriptional regulator with XRE-family HTH domain
MDIGALLRDSREAAGMSAASLALQAGVSEASLSSYERGTRTPRLEQIDRILAVLGLQLRLAVEPLYADIDGAMAQAAALPLAERLERLGVRPVGLLVSLGNPPCVIEGACAAALLGAPLPVPVIDLALLNDDAVLEGFSRWATRNARRWSDRWGRYGFIDPDPRYGPDPLRYETGYGDVRLRLVDRLPDSTAVDVNGEQVRVLDLRLLTVGDPASARVIERMRQRLASDHEH